MEKYLVIYISLSTSRIPGLLLDCSSKQTKKRRLTVINRIIKNMFNISNQYLYTY